MICPSISGNVEAVEQALALCELLDNESYTHKAAPFVQSSIGEHLRHIVDMYLALMNEPTIKVVDYDRRRRGAPIETQLSVGIAELEEIRAWLDEMPASAINRPITILSEASITTQKTCEMPSTLQRELLFVSSHTIHHLAILKIITIHLNIQTNDQLGYAPATATHLRNIQTKGAS